LVIELRNGGLSAKPPFIQQSTASRLADLERDDVRWDRQDGADFVAWQGARKASMQRIAADERRWPRIWHAPKAAPPQRGCPQGNHDGSIQRHHALKRVAMG
jgi:hypothetical protein